MNTVLSYLKKNWQRLQLGRFGSSTELSSVMLTPRFHASSHIIFFILSAHQKDPILVAKVPRLAGDNSRLNREASILRKIQAVREGGFDSIPSLIAYEDWQSNRILLETVVKGQVMRPSLVRQQSDLCLQRAMNWLLEVHLASTVNSEKAPMWFEDLVEYPMDNIKNSLPLAHEEHRIIERASGLVEPLRSKRIPLVFEHGDFSAPNVLIQQNASIGVVDWELAEPVGIPCADLFFFLTFVAFAKNSAGINNDYLKAFQTAFFLSSGWSSPYILLYCKRLKIASELLKPLFVLTWTRYLAGIVMRLKDNHTSDEVLSSETTEWLRSNRYYLLWRYAIEYIDKFCAVNDGRIV